MATKKELVDAMQHMAYSSRDLARAASIYERMLRDQDCGVILCLAGSLISAGLKQIFDARTTDKILYVKADKNLDYSKVLDAIDIAAHNGVRVVGAISDQQPGTESTVAGDLPSTTKKP